MHSFKEVWVLNLCIIFIFKHAISIFKYFYPMAALKDLFHMMFSLFDDSKSADLLEERTELSVAFFICVCQAFSH